MPFKLFSTLDIDVEASGIDLMSMSAHKMYGPKGVGALYVRRRKPRVRLLSQIDGGGHERGMRSGTLNVPGIVGMGKAAEIVMQDRESDVEHLKTLRDRLWQGVSTKLNGVVFNGDPDHHLPNNANISFMYVEGESISDGNERYLCQLGVGLYIRQLGTLLCIESAWGFRRISPFLYPLWFVAFHN